MTIYPAVGRNGYCVPGAIAMLTGLSTDAAAKEIRSDWPELRAVRGVPAFAWVKTMARVLARDGYAMQKIDDVSAWPTVQAFARARSIDGTWLVAASHHLLIVTARRGVVEIGDNKTVYPVPVERFHGRLTRVSDVWLIREMVR